MRARLRLCVVTHTRELFFSIQRGKKKKHPHLHRRESVRIRKSKYATTPNDHHQTKSLGRYTKEQRSILRKRSVERARARRHSFREKKNSTFFSQKKVTKKDAETFPRCSPLCERFIITRTKHIRARINEHTNTTNTHEHRTTVFVIELRFHRRHGKRDSLAQE